MADIEMCQNKMCLSSQDCYRFNAKPDPIMQSHCAFAFNNDGSCAFYIPIDKDDNHDKNNI